MEPQLRSMVLAVILGWAALSDPTTGLARPPASLPAWLPNPVPLAESLHNAFTGLGKLESVEMVSAIAGGSKLGPGEAWFHPGQSRYGWKWLAARCDANKDGKIERREFPGSDDLFKRLDRDHDGVLTAADFDWSDSSPLAQRARLARTLFYFLDANSNGRVSRQEWDAFFARAAAGKSYLTPDDLREAMQPRSAGKPGTSDDGPSPLVFLKGLLCGELGSMLEGPGVGQLATDFTLPTFDGKGKIRLSQFRGQKPVVLVFGNFT